MLLIPLLVVSIVSAVSQCEVCHALVTLLDVIVASNLTLDAASHLIENKVCPRVLGPKITMRVCKATIRTFAPTVWPLLSSRIERVDICGFVGACDDTRRALPLHAHHSVVEERRKRVNSAVSRASGRRAPQTSGETAMWPLKAKKEFRVMQVSDIHLDSMYKVGSNAQCDEPLCCRFSRGVTPETAAPVLGAYECDLSPTLFDKWLAFAKTMDLDAIIVTGDMTPHDIWNESVPLQLERLTKINMQLRGAFPSMPVYFSAGNHDSYPVDIFSVHGKDDAHHDDFVWLRDGFASSWGVSKDAKETVLAGGYYAAPFAPGIKLISFNSAFYDGLNFYLWLADDKNVDFVAFVAKELKQAEAAGDKVILVGHIPLNRGSDTLPGSVLADFVDLLVQYNDTIVASLAGHTHSDEFQLINGQDGVAGVMYIAPSLTTFVHQNPSMRVYSVSGSGTFLDYEQWRLNLTDALATGKTDWSIAYTAKDTYGLADLSPLSWATLVQRMWTDAPLFGKWFNNYVTGFPHDPPTRTDVVEQLCNLQSTTPKEATRCVLEHI